MADHGSSLSEQSSPTNPVDTPEDIQSVGSSTDAWIQHSLNQLHTQIEKIDGKIDDRFDKVDGKIDDRFDKVVKRLTPIETKINYAVAGIAGAVVVVSFLGWILSPFLKAIAEKMISGG